MIRIIKVLRHLTFIVFHINWWKFFRLLKKGSENVVISNFLTSGKFSTEGTCWEFGYINYFIKNNINFDYCSLRTQLYGRRVYWSPEKATSPFNVRNYPSTFVHVAKQLEEQGCNCFPNSFEINFLENKKFMHSQFSIKNTPHPQTFVLSSVSIQNNQVFNPNNKIEKMPFPLLWKGEHSSGSQDIELLKDETDLANLLETPDFKVKNPSLIFQEFFDIRRDLRVVVIGEEVVLCFWRINPRKNWAPTASKFGSTISFENLPTHLYPKFIKEMSNLDLTMGGFDVIFEDDDPEKSYRILEVSPRYSPNPPADMSMKKYSYAEYKHRVFVRRSWAYLQTQIIFEHADKYVGFTLKR